jgi:hypothetical protein
MKQHRTALAIPLLALVCQVPAPVQVPAHVEAFGGIQEPLKPLSVPTELKPYVPNGVVLRAVLQTKMSPEGETLLLYDDGEEIFPEVHLHAVRNGKDMTLFDGVVAGVAGLLPIRPKQQQQLVGFAFHVGADQSDTTFVIFKGQANSYRQIFEQNTTAGRMKLLSDSPVRFEIWSADWKLDQGESCVWCPHRYRVRTYVWHANAFTLVTQRITSVPLDPGEIVQKTFVVSPSEN